MGSATSAEIEVPLFCENFCFFYTHQHHDHQHQHHHHKIMRGIFLRKKIMIDKIVRFLLLISC